MPLNRPSLDTLRSRINADIELSTGNNPSLRGTIEHAIANALAAISHVLHGVVAFLADQLFDDTAEQEYLERRAGVFGITKILAVAATGNITITGTDATVIEVGTELQSPDGQLYTTDAQVTIASSTATAVVTASAAGAAGNQAAASSLTFTSPISGADGAAAVDGSGLITGADVESGDRLKERFADRKKTPPRGGSSDDYVAWTKQASVDVTRVWPVRNKNNLDALEYGSVVVYFATDDLATPIPTAGHITTVDDYLNLASIRPIGAKQIYVEAPVAKALDITFTSLDPNNATVKAAIAAEVADLLKREAKPNGTILLSHIREAISIATGENDYTMTVPSADVTTLYNEMVVLGTITWP